MGDSLGAHRHGEPLLREGGEDPRDRAGLGEDGARRGRGSPSATRSRRRGRIRPPYRGVGQRDVGVGVHRSRICLLGEGGQDADRVADADMESPAELGDRSVEGLRSGEERSAPVGPAGRAAQVRSPARDDLVVGLGGGGPGGIVLEAEVATEPDDGGGHRFDYERSAACGCSPPKWIDDPLRCPGSRRSPVEKSRDRRINAASPGAASRVPAMPYEVHTPVFDGPFDLLLHLILREQVDLYEINLNEIVDAYLGELDRMEQLDLEVATEFLLIAATLVELKARPLPDDDEIDLDDELGLWEERDLCWRAWSSARPSRTLR